MKLFIKAAVAVVLTLGIIDVAGAEVSKPMNKTGGKEGTVGGVGAMGNVDKTGVATDPQQIKAQSGHTTASPGTVGAAPGTNAPSSNAGH